jgi:hypothetical protein
MMETVRKLLGTFPVRLLILLVVTYWVAALLLPGKLLAELGDAYAVPMSFAAGVMYVRSVILSLSSRSNSANPDTIDFLLLCIGGAWLSNSIDRLTRLWARLYDQDILNSPLIGFFLLLLTFFAAGHILIRSELGRGTTSSLQPAGVLFNWTSKRVVLCAIAWGVLITALILLKGYYWR